MVELKIIEEVSNDKKQKINDYYITQRIKEIETLNKYTDLDKAEEKIFEYYDEQLKDFIKEHNQFNNLIKEVKNNG